MAGGYAGDYSSNLKSDPYDVDDDDELEDQLPKNIEVKGKSRKRLDFGDDRDEESSKSESQTMRLLRSVSFGNDTQIMSKLKLLKDDFISSEKKNGNKNSSPDKTSISTKSSDDAGSQRRSASVESSNSLSLESKINQYYEPLGDSRDTSVEKSASSSREVTPDDSHVSKLLLYEIKCNTCMLLNMYGIWVIFLGNLPRNYSACKFIFKCSKISVYPNSCK